jgi:hypothetical protein
MAFTNLDKALLDRCARGLRNDAAALLYTHGSNWQASKESRKMKLEYDRLQRDAHDLSILAKRMTGEEKQRKKVADVPMTASEVQGNLGNYFNALAEKMVVQGGKPTPLPPATIPANAPPAVQGGAS